MINIILAVVIILAAAGGVCAVVKRARGESCCGGGPSEVKIEPADKNKKNYSFIASVKIDGMKCKNCASKIQSKLNSLDGVFAKVNFAKKNAEILLKKNCQEGIIKKAVSDAGYSLVSYSENEKND